MSDGGTHEATAAKADETDAEAVSEAPRPRATPSQSEVRATHVNPRKKVRAFAAHDPRRATTRAALAVLVALGVAYLVPASMGTPTRAIAGWDAGGFVLLIFSWWLLLSADAEETRRRAVASDPGRAALGVIILLTSMVGFFAAALAIRHAHDLAPGAEGTLCLLSLLGVICAWLITHTGYTFRYARLYYRGGKDCEGGLVFQGEEAPRDVDFAYFAFTLGMCFQTSDVAISTSTMRRTVLTHALLSFAYNTVILALAMNLVLGLLN